jgi:hypothetical protein
MQPPPGTDARPSNVLLADDEPLVMRCVLHGGGKDGKYGRIIRAIAVGFPNLTSYVFDAQTSQLCYAWTGGFVDMTSGWSERGDSSGRRVGRPFYTAGEGSAIHVGSLEAAPKTDFKAYALNKKIPEFVYVVDGVQVTERIAPLEKGIGIVRRFEIDSPTHPVFFTTPDDSTLNIAADKGTFEKLKGQMVLKVDAAPKVRFSVTISVKDAK